MATLKNLVDEITTIKNELVACHTNLKTNLKNKNIETSSSDKLDDLITKVSDITLENLGGMVVATGMCVLSFGTENFTVRNLNFKPSLVLAIAEDKCVSIMASSGGISNFPNSKVMVGQSSTYGNFSNFESRLISDNRFTAEFYEDGFLFQPMANYQSNINITWFAFK